MLKTTLNLLISNVVNNNRYMQGVTRRLLSNKDIEAQELLDEIYSVVCNQRFKNIVVVQTKFNANPRYIILADAFNARHLVNGTEMVNKEYKTTIKKPEQSFAKFSISSEWNVVDFDAVVVHLFSKGCREHFDIEQLWAVGEKFDDLTNFPQNNDSDATNMSSSSSSFLG